MYRPPGGSNEEIEQSLIYLQEILVKASNLNTKCIITGDFNLCLLNYKTHALTSNLIDMMFSAGYIQVIKNPTRISQNVNHRKASLIDHIWVSSSSISHEAGIITTHFSDHFATFYLLSSIKNNKQRKAISYRNFSNENVDRFVNSLNQMSFDNVLQANDAQSSYNIFDETFYKLFDDQFPVENKVLNKNRIKLQSWMTSGILKSRCTKLNLAKLSRSVPTQANINKFKIYKNVYNLVIRKRKKMYFSDELIKCQGNLKKSWDIIREAIGIKKSAKQSTDELIINNISVRDEKCIANSFNDHFSSIALKLRENITPTDRPPDSFLDESDLSFEIPLISPLEIENIVKSLEDKLSLDFSGISMNLVKRIIKAISLPLSHIFNLSIRTGVFPNQFKLARVCPVYKRSGSENDVNNFRPISLVSTFSKILEKHVCSHLKNYLTSNNILDHNQFGFQKNNSTYHPMIKLLNYVGDAINKKEFTIAIFCDLQKAFDMCPINIILMKLKKYGIKDKSLDWFKSYLTDRKQFVQFGNSKSNFSDVKSGVPQGSILGPILFLLFFNDLPKSTLLEILLFCDDTTILASGSNLPELILLVNNELQKISQWFRSNLMSLHPNKTKFTIFHPSQLSIPTDEIHLFINENDPGSVHPISSLKKEISYVNHLSEVPAIKFLGVYFDPNLSFKYHINELNLKLSKSLFILNKSKNILSVKAMKSLYYSLFHCHLLYGLHAYSCSAPSNIESLVKKQKKAMRCIVNARYNAHTGPLFKDLKILPLKAQIQLNSLQFMSDFINNRLPRSFVNMWVTNHELNNRYNLRNANDFRVPFGRTELVKRLPLCAMPRKWNDFDNNHIKSTISKFSFKANVKKYLLEKVSTDCSRLNCPLCSE